MNMGNYALTETSPYSICFIYIIMRESRGKPILDKREGMDRMYTAAPDGYCGDEDNGKLRLGMYFLPWDFIPFAGNRSICNRNTVV